MLAGAALALLAPSTAMASACGDRILADWFDNGRIDRSYPVHCYREAIDSIPSDISDYTNAEEVIARALQQAASGSSGGGTPSDPSNPAEQPSGGGAAGPNDPGDPGTGGGDTGTEVTPAVDASGPSSIPIPLILLAAMSLLLLGAGGLGYLSRRRTAAADGSTDVPGDDEIVG